MIPGVVRGDTSSAFAVIPSVVCVDIMRHPRWNLARLGICTPCNLKNPICFWFLGFCGFYAACAEAVGQMDLFYGTGTHYDKNCWVSGEVLWLSARGSFWKHHIMAKNGSFKAPSQSPSGGRENPSSIYPNKFIPHNAENPKGLSFFSTFLNCLVLCSWFSAHDSLLMVLCSKKYRGSSCIRTAPAFTLLIYYIFSRSR